MNIIRFAKSLLKFDTYYLNGHIGIVLVIYFLFSVVRFSLDALSIGVSVSLLMAYFFPDLFTVEEPKFLLVLQFLHSLQPSDFLLVFSVVVTLFYVSKILFQYLALRFESLVVTSVSKRVFQEFVNNLKIGRDYDPGICTNFLIKKTSDVISNVVSPLGDIAFIILLVLGLVLLAQEKVDLFWIFGSLVGLVGLLGVLILASRRVGSSLLNHIDHMFSSLRSNFECVETYISPTDLHRVNDRFRIDFEMMRLFSDWVRLLKITPRTLLELLFLLGLAAFFINGDVVEEVSVVWIASLAAVAQRLLPLFGSLSGFLSGVAAATQSMDDLLDLAGKRGLERGCSADATKSVDLIAVNRLSTAFPVSIDFDFRFCRLRLKKGDSVLISGQSGVGKSTILRALVGLVEIDWVVSDIRINGREIMHSSQFPLENYCYLPQRSFLAGHSVAECITGNRHILISEIPYIEEVLAVVELDVVSLFDLPFAQAITSELGDNGAKFSGGQRQRLALAQALFKRKAVNFFDESLSALDKDAENRVVRNVLRYLERWNGLSIWVSHSEALATEFDKVVTIAHGGRCSVAEK